ncbi:MAG TPA: proton-conducting transporter membrane subunit [Candidatus Omnitrophota bacterium]|nr:proton-conducting transporter membrane subunit [Candidatus Omnitrophota bacterium]
MLSLFILIPLLLLFILNLPVKFIRQGAFGLVGLLLSVQILAALLHSLFPWSAFPEILGSFFIFSLAVDNLTLVMLLTIGTVALVSLIVAASTIGQERLRFYFVNLLLICVIGMNAIVLVRDIFSLYVFIEIVSVSSFILIALERNKSAIEGTFKYLMLSAMATVFILSGIACFLLAAGDLSFVSIHSAFYDPAASFILKVAASLFLCGLFIKAGVAPFHGWVMDAYLASPASVSVLLAGVATKISGVYVLLRLFGSVFIVNAPLQNIILFAGAFSIVLGALAALTQDDLKRMLAYSSISQIGYIILALGCATPLAFAGAVFHFFNHAIFKSLLFVNAAALEKRFGSTDMNKLAGQGYKMPVTGITSLMGVLSTAGIPPLSGFWSKLIIILALFSSGRFVYAGIALLASVLTLAYFLVFQRRIFFCKSELQEPALENPGKISRALGFSEISLAIITVVTGAVFVFMPGNWIMPLKGIFW